ncbi:MalY/PatB family protein [Serratia sp. M24T3]|uniref:MalY/PatB family protein n=1 Tax=Serratia sp. M24T3 TaxID=932213 RepID=UPI00025B9B95|nr:PatB family C-S lyase [Serratia sp. M24T3]EIC85986.1 class I and II aminotransferase [Serratia sp. M24T3]
MTFNFDQWVDRSHSDSVKWNKYRDSDVIPLWVADTDFKSPPAVINALQQRVAEGVFGYGSPPQALIENIVSRMHKRYDWTIKPEWIVWLPGLVCGLNLAVRAFTTAQQASIMPSPIYPPFMQAAQSEGRRYFSAVSHQQDKRWITDYSQLETRLDGSEKLLMLCNPYNPGGTVYRREELLAHLDFAQRHDLIVCSDEIHCDLLLEPGLCHIPFASLNEEAANRSVTLMSPSKTFNLAGLGASLAIVPNEELRLKFALTAQGIVPHVNILAFVAATAAYSDGQNWLTDQLTYLRGNRDLVFQRINAMPGLRMLKNEGTYLGWIDATEAQLPSPYRFFLDAGVGLSDGKDFGSPDFVRINLGCQRALLEKALDRMESALAAR